MARLRDNSLGAFQLFGRGMPHANFQQLQLPGERDPIVELDFLVGFERRARNVVYAFGHGHSGLTGAPMTGQLVAALVADEMPAIDMHPFRRDRF